MKNIRKRIMTYLAHEVALPYFRLMRKGYKFPYTVKQLQRFPDGTVGKELFHFFMNNKLDMLPDYEKHDIKHVVLGYPPSEEGEVSLQCFMLANGRITFPVIFIVIVGLTIMPDKWNVFREAWKRGRTTHSLKNLDWFGLVPQQLNIVTNKIFNFKNI
jgi:hypothetical protein